MSGISLHSPPSPNGTADLNTSPLERLERAASNRIGHSIYNKSPAPSISDYDFEDIILPPPPTTAFTARTAYGANLDHPSPLEDYAHSPLSRHRRTLTESFLDKVKLPPVSAKAGQINLSIPTSKSLASFIPSLTTSPEASEFQAKEASTARTRFNSLAGNWFNGSSAPVNLGFIPSSSPKTIEDQEIDEMDHLTSRHPHNRQASLAQSTTSRLAWLSNKISNATATTTSRSAPIPDATNSDPLLNIDITAELFPHGAPDPLAPHAFHDLLTNAEKLIGRLATGYRAKSREVTELRLEQDAQADELDEALTRADHLKMQLETMAERAKVQEETMRSLVEELANERRLRVEEADAHRRRNSIRVVSTRGKRNSTGSRNSDSGFESDDAESKDTDSIFTADDSCSLPTSPQAMSRDCSPRQSMFENDAASSTASVETQPRRLTYGWTSKARVSDASEVSCRYDGGLRDENKMLRARVVELENTVESCLDLVAGL